MEPNESGRNAAIDPAHGSAMDYEEHERTYRTFVRFVRYATIATPLLLAFVFYWTR